MVEILFTQDFATKKKGDKWQCDSMLANHLINVDKVAEKLVPEKKEDKKTVDKKVEKK